MNLLLKNIFYGNELPQLEEGSEALRHWFSDTWPRLHDSPAPDINWSYLYQLVRQHFKRPRPGMFDGPITAGDGVAIISFMAVIRPDIMIEVGTASGFSSAFILEAATALELTTKDEVFLHSLDITAEREEGFKTGQLLTEAYPHLTPNWQLHAPATSLDLIDGTLNIDLKEKKVLSFIDGGHEHPWPLTDVVAMRKLLPENSWLLLQDVQIMERWIADCVLYGAPSGVPVRGAQIACSNWPGSKWIGLGICYNMAGLKLDVSDAKFEKYIAESLGYPDECLSFDRSLIPPQ